jgi:cysteinyl-tRNA synthetase
VVGLLQDNPTEFLQQTLLPPLFINANMFEGSDTLTATLTVKHTPASINHLIAARTAAKQAKNYAEADRIRKELLAEGIVLEDSATGTTWRRD